MTQQFDEFRKEILKVNGKRKPKVTDSYKIEEIHRAYCKDNPSIPLRLYSSIIRAVNQHICESILKGNTIVLPCNMGTLRLIHVEHRSTYTGDKLRVGYPVDWLSTLKLWHSDEEAKRNKTLIRYTKRNHVKLIYDRSTAKYVNRDFYDILFNRQLKLNIRNLVDQGLLDAIYK